MRRLCGASAAALLALCAGGCRAAASPLVPSVGEVSPTAQHYALDLTWQARQRALSGTEQIRFTNATSGDLKRVWLRLWPNGQSGCGHPFLTVRVVSGGSSGPLAVGCTALPITL